LVALACGGFLLPSAPDAAFGQPPTPSNAPPAERARPDPPSSRDRTPGSKPLSAQEVFRRLLPSTCWVFFEVRVGSDTRISNGTGGFADTRRRLIVTTDHVVDGIDFVRVPFPTMKDGRAVNDFKSYLNNVEVITGTVIDRSPQCDLALIQLA